ncbi:MAG: sterol desaturase family protein [Rhodobacteraceae bacterium]|nr:sterol desaturase family protein [Paracoccaceae bacterium]
MEFLSKTYSEWQVYAWEVSLGDWFFALSLAFLAFELARLATKKALSWNLLGDTVANFVTLALFIAMNLAMTGLVVAAYYYVYENFSLTQLPINGWTILLCVLLADLVYYWEHRFMHRVGIGWATHTVHHSSPYFNISVAYRFGPLDGFIPLFFHIPLVMLGFNPLVVFFSEVLVQLYQTALHTETVKKLPRPVEAVMNTPSHHRVHHGSNPQYIDKNYAGIFIIWDRMFGTFEEEREKVVYGVVPPLNSINPVHVFVHGLTKLAGQVWTAKGWRTKLAYLVKPPGWTPKG